ncbi:MAG TPA: hypothetical protein VGW38_28840, partial [Chloroflexota bacterium]|nr:hypothetical protein [Chloroflexota bacterium]
MHEKPTPTTTASQLHLIQEGATEFLVPPSLSSGKARGPGRARAGVFFNPASAFARDLSVLYLAAVVQPGMRVLDGLTGVGARASRWRREAPGDYQLTANDESPQAIAIARLNLCTGGAETPRVLQRPLGALLAEEPFDLIELDAAGTPMPFLDAACQSVLAALTGSHPGHLLVTATDSLVLAGVQPDVCRRRYGARPLRGELAQEIAVRMLVGAIVQTAARYGLAADPALSYWHAHVYGAFVRLVKDYRAADAA